MMIEALEQQFRIHTNPDRALAMSAYMRYQFPFYGIPASLRQDIALPVFKAYPPESAAELHSLARAMWQKPEREWHYTGILLISKYKKLWTPDLIELLHDLLLQHSWWDSVDGLCSNCVAPYFQRFGDKRFDVLDAWEKSGHMWLIRVCIIHQLSYRKASNLTYLKGIVARQRHSDEFFIQKAIGWALRQYAKTDPAWVMDFTATHTLKPLSLREAIKNIRQ